MARYHADTRIRLFADCVLFLEERERGDQVCQKNNWGWLFRWPPPWHEVAFILVGLVHQPNHPDVDRAWAQVESIFQRHNGADFSLHRYPAWKALERLCDQAMYFHPERLHVGKAYSQRLDKKASSSGSSPAALFHTIS